MTLGDGISTNEVLKFKKTYRISKLLNCHLLLLYLLKYQWKNTIKYSLNQLQIVKLIQKQSSRDVPIKKMCSENMQ